MNKQELLNKLNEMYEDADNSWYEIYMKHSGEWHTTHPDSPMYERAKTIKEIIELVNNL